MSVTPPSEPGDPRPDLRVSDADREQVAALVRRAVGDGRLTLVEGDERLAAAYAARHRSALAPVVADLGGLAAATGESATGGSPAARPAGDPSAVDRPTSTTSIAVMGGADRAGVWVPGATHHAVAVMGGVELDLRQAALGGRGIVLSAVAVMGGIEVDLRGIDPGPDGVTIQALVLMGGVNVRVDGHVRVENQGLALMGAFDPGGRSAPTPAGASTPVVRLRGLAVMGGVSVQRTAADPAVGGADRPALG